MAEVILVIFGATRGIFYGPWENEKQRKALDCCSISDFRILYAIFGISGVILDWSRACCDLFGSISGVAGLTF